MYGDQNAWRMLIGFSMIFVIVASQSLPVAVVEDAVAADEQVVAVAGGERRGDRHLLAVALRSQSQ